MSNRLAAMLSICAEFTGSDVNVFRHVVRRSPRTTERIEFMFRFFVRREARFSAMR